MLFLQHLAALAVAADQTSTPHQPSLPPLLRENFSFSGKVLVGDFLQPTGMSPDQVVRLTDAEVAQRLEELQALRSQIPQKERAR